MKAEFTALALASLAYAAPARRDIIPRVADFEGLVVPVSVASLTPIDTYKGLNWQGFNVIDVGDALTGVRPTSGEKVGVQYIATTGIDPTATLLTADDTNYFAVQSFNFGCVLSSQETLAGVVTACDVIVTGKRNGRTVASQEVSFSPEGLLGALGADMRRVNLKGFNVVDEVSFELQGALSAATSVLYDDVKYITYTD